MYLKSFLMIGWTITTYVLLVFTTLPLILKILLIISLSFSVSGIMMCIGHDGCHQSYSKNRLINNIAAKITELVSSSTYLWHYSHNVMHHKHPNTTNYDNDINQGIFVRFSPYQPHYFFHKFQHIYIWFLYSTMMLKWLLFNDYYRLWTGRIGTFKLPKMSRNDKIYFVFGKLFYCSLAFIIPLFSYNFLTVLIFYTIFAAIHGITLAIIFAVAHVTKKAEFFKSPPDDAIGSIIRQLQSTVNFCPRNKLLSWYLGGLNFQVEHHLFPKISHVHYPQIASIVKETCKKYGIVYNCNDTFWEALKGHYFLLKALGREAPIESH